MLRSFARRVYRRFRPQPRLWYISVWFRDQDGYQREFGKCFMAATAHEAMELMMPHIPERIWKAKTQIGASSVWDRKLDTFQEPEHARKGAVKFCGRLH